MRAGGGFVAVQQGGMAYSMQYEYDRARHAHAGTAECVTEIESRGPMSRRSIGYPVSKPSYRAPNSANTPLIRK